MSTVKKSKADKHDRATAIIFTVLIILILIPFVMFYVYPRVTDQSRFNTQLSIPRISSPVISSSDGSSHNVDIAVVFEIDSKAAKNIDTKELQKYAEDTVAKMDFDKITDAGSTDYIKAALNKELVQYIGENNLKGIYLMDVKCDQINIVEQGSSEQNQLRNNALKSLFPNSGN